MRILVLLLLMLLCPAMASSQEWCAKPICARFEGTDLIRIRAPGRFELTFTKAQGFGAELYDLQADPDKLHHLSGATLGGDGILWTKIAEVGDSSSYFADNATNLELLEQGGVRVRASHSGKHHRYGLPDQPWDDLGYVQTFTVYATGEVYIDYDLVASRDIPLGVFTMIIRSTGDWGNYVDATAPGEAHCVGDHGLDPPYGDTASAFAMVSSNGSHYYADVLMAMYSGTYPHYYWNEGYLADDFRCSLSVYGLLPTVPTGTSHIPLMMRIAEDMNDPAGGSKYSDAFRNPDTAFSVLQGTRITTDPGDRDADGFNEEEGTYVLRRQPAHDVEFVLHADRTRPNPAFKILDWGGSSPRTIQVNNTTWQQGTQFRASVSGGNLILQLLGDQTQDAHVLVPSATKLPGLTGPGGVAIFVALLASGAGRLARSRR